MEFTLTRSQARQFIVLWQGLSGPYRWRTNAEIVGLVHQLGCLQFDPIDICGRNADPVSYTHLQCSCLGFMAVTPFLCHQLIMS